jgi:hypothetical protein
MSNTPTAKDRHDEIVHKLAEVLFYDGNADVRADHPEWTLGQAPESIVGKRPDVTTDSLVALVETDPGDSSNVDRCKMVASIARRQGRQFWLVVPDEREDAGEDILDEVDEIAVTRLLSFSDVDTWHKEKVAGL